MTYTEFCEKLDNSKNEAEWNATIKSIITNEYVPYATKCNRANDIINTTCFEHTVAEDGTVERGNINIKSAIKDMYEVMSIVDLYTAIDLTPADFLWAYDALESRGALGDILSKIEKTEVASFRRVVDNFYNDAMTNEYEIHAYINNAIKTIVKGVEVIAPVLEKGGEDSLLSKIKNLIKR